MGGPISLIKGLMVKERISYSSTTLIKEVLLARINHIALELFQSGVFL
jgi:hypothetical protein